VLTTRSGCRSRHAQGRAVDGADEGSEEDEDESKNARKSADRQAQRSLKIPTFLSILLQPTGMAENDFRPGNTAFLLKK
jgi:hypothetical protein